MHMNVMVACDFSCKTVWTPLGKHVSYVLTFVHLGSRKVFASPSTLNPTDEWMRQQARNASMWADGEGIGVRFLIHNRDTKFTEAFDEYFHRDKGGVVLMPYGAPIGSSFAESWIGSLKRECLNLLFCFSLRQLDHIVQTYALYHNKFRLHQGLDNMPPGATGDLPQQAAEDDARVIRPKHWLGGLLSHYYRQAG